MNDKVELVYELSYGTGWWLKRDSEHYWNSKNTFSLNFAKLNYSTD